MLRTGRRGLGHMPEPFTSTGPLGGGPRGGLDRGTGWRPQPQCPGDSCDGSEALFARASAVTPGGVNSPVRAFRAVGGTPRFIRSASGARLTDVDGHEYVDLAGSWGPMLLGHAHPDVMAAVHGRAHSRHVVRRPDARPRSTSPRRSSAVRRVEQVRLVSSGTEATMSAIRLARGFTGRDVVVKFAGCYHGHVDALLASAGSA